MARCLIIACGCRGTALASELRARGHTVRGTSRDPDRAAALARAGIDGVHGDPDRVATLARALEHVSVACILLGSATGSEEHLAALHSTRLDMLLSKMIDSTVRGIVYEAAGQVPAAILDRGARRVRAFCEDSRVPYVLLDSARAEHAAWLGEAVAAVESVLGPPAG